LVPNNEWTRDEESKEKYSESRVKTVKLEGIVDFNEEGGSRKKGVDGRK
jgi:hypothetical protein